MTQPATLRSALDPEQTESPLLLPKILAAVREALGDEVADEHFLARLIQQDLRAGTKHAEWFDSRYRRVFSNPNFMIEEPRRRSLRHRLHEPEQFRDTDAEIQLAATILRNPAVRVTASPEGQVPGQRMPDYVVALAREIDVEVRSLNDPDTERTIDAAAGRVLTRLRKPGLPAGLWAKLRVRRFHDTNGDVVLDPTLEKAFANLCIREIAAGTWRNGHVYITVRQGKASVWDGRTSLYGEVASLELSRGKLPRGHIVTFSPMTAPAEADVIYRALRKKGERKQRVGNRPWVLVVDPTGTSLFFSDELKTGIEKYLRSSRSVSAVVLQRRTFALSGLRLDVLGARFQSVAFSNPKATFVLTDQERELFEDDDGS